MSDVIGQPAASVQHPALDEVLHHPLFSAVDRSGCSRSFANAYAAQFWHPSHYFPNFLSRLISVVPDLATKTHLSRILWQELGEGDPSRAHEAVYVATLTSAGLGDPSAPESEPLASTKRLVSFYEEAGADPLLGTGALFGTEAIDLTIVSALGTAVMTATGADSLEWVTLHQLQEPDHAESASNAADLANSRILDGAVEVWNGWRDFYTELHEVLD